MEVLNLDHIKFYGENCYFLKVGKNKIYVKDRDGEMREISIQEIPGKDLRKVILQLFDYEIEDLIRKLEAMKETDRRILNRLKGIFLAYEAEKRAITSKIKRSQTLKI